MAAAPVTAFAPNVPEVRTYLNGETLAEVMKSITAYKSHRTRCTNALDEALAGLGGAAPAPDVLAEMRTILIKLQSYCDSLVNGFGRVMELGDAVEAGNAVTGATRAAALYHEYRALVQAAAGLVVPAQPVAAAPAPAAPANDAARVVRPIKELKPEQLASDSTPAEFADWARRYKAYHSSSALERGTIPQQQNYLLACIDYVLRTRLVSHMHDALPIFDPPQAPAVPAAAAAGAAAAAAAAQPAVRFASCFQVLEQYFKQRCPLSARRAALFALRQKPGEQQTDCIARIRRQAAECDLTAFNMDKLLVQLFIMSCQDERLRRKFLEPADPTAEQLELVAESYVRITAGTAGTADRPVATVAAAQPGGGRQPQQKKAGGRRRVSGHVQRLIDSGLCTRCAASDHQRANCRLPATVTCHRCGKPGHIAPACSQQKDKGQARVQAASQDQQQQQLQPPSPAPPPSYDASHYGDGTQDVGDATQGRAAFDSSHVRAARPQHLSHLPNPNRPTPDTFL